MTIHRAPRALGARGSRLGPTLPRPSHALRVAILLLGALLTPQAAPAQGSDGVAIIDLTPLLSVGPVDGGPAPSPPPAEPSGEEEAAPLIGYSRGAGTAEGRAPSSGPPQMFLPALGGQGPDVQRLTGEYSELAVEIQVPTGAVVEGFDLVYRTSINVLPEASQLTASLNGVEIASWAPTAFDGFATVALPPDGLEPGVNRLVVRAQQSHRIYCGPAATFEIWTEIDTVRTGARLSSAGTGIDPASFRAAAVAQLATAASLPVVASSLPDPALLESLRARLAAAAPGVPFALAVRSPYEAGDGAMPLARIAVVPASDGPGLEIRRDRAGSLVLVIAEDLPPGDLDVVLPTLGPEGDAAPALVPGAPRTLESLGTGDIVMRNRYERRDIALRLPDDWLLLSSQKARLDLSYGYARDLPEGSVLLVNVNDVTVRLLPLFGRGGETLPVLPIGFPARLLDPGINTLSFVAVIPGDPVDQSCPIIDGSILQVSGLSEVFVPTSPRMHFADLGYGLDRLGPQAITGVAGMALGGRAEQAQVMLASMLAPPAAGAGEAQARLVIAEVGTLNRVPLAAVGLGRAGVEAALSTPLPLVPEPQDRGQPAAGLLLGFGSTYRQELSGGLDRAWARLRAMAWPGDPALATWLDGRHGEALLFMPDPDAPGDLVLVLGRQADPEAVAQALAAGREDIHGPGGQAALLSADGTWASWHPAASPPRLDEPLTFSNARTVAGNYASWSPFAFVSLLAALMSASVVLGLIFVVRTRGSRSR